MGLVCTRNDEIDKICGDQICAEDYDDYSE